MEAELPDDVVGPDEDDYDLVEVPDPAEIADDEPPERGEGESDEVVAEMEPQPVAVADQPIDVLDPFMDPGAVRIVPAIDEPGGGGGSDEAIVRRWLPRLRIREQLLAAARAELAAATSEEARRRAKAKVAQREAQVAYARRIIERHQRPQTTVVERVVRAALLAYKHRDNIGYTMDRPFELQQQGGVPMRWDGIKNGRRAKNGQYPHMADCSSFVTWCWWDALGGPSAGADIINGANWTQGWTGSQIEHGRKVAISEARAGDLAFYQRGNSIGHVTVVVAPGKVISHGSQEGPLSLPIDWHNSQLQFVRRYLN